MSRLLLTEDLLEEFRRRAVIPNTQADGSANSDLLDMLNDEMLYEVVPQIMNTREEYFVVTEEIALLPSVTRYRIPIRAIGNKLRRTTWVDQAGSPTIRDDLICVSPDYVVDYDASNRITKPQAYYIEGNFLVVLPNMSSTPTGVIEASFYFRPGKLVESSRYATVSAVSASQITVTAQPSEDPFVVGVSIDIHGSASGADVKSYSNKIVSVASDVINLTDVIDGTIAGTLPVVVGDYVMVENEAAAPMGIPMEIVPIIVQAACVRYAENKGTPEEVEMHKRTLDRQQHRVSQMLNMRVEGQPKKIVNRTSLWRSNRRRWRR